MSTDTVIEKKVVKQTARKNKEPGKYKVIVCNDDSTPIEFVISMLIAVFKHSEKSALELTLKIHNSGSAIAGIYAHEVAEQKQTDATTLARGHGYPLIIKVEEE